MDFLGIAITFLAGILTYLGWKNGRWMKLAHEETRSLIRSTHEETQSLIRSTHEETQRLIRSTHEETQSLIKSLHEDTLAVLREIANLIHEEGKKTRESLQR